MKVVKRDLRIVDFDDSKIRWAVERAFQAAGEPYNGDTLDKIVYTATYLLPDKYLIGVETIQDKVEEALMIDGFYNVARRYIIYREEHAQQRKAVPANVKEAFAADEQYFDTELQKFQFYDKYSRFNYDLGRRETWVETVSRAVEYLRELSQNKLDDDDYNIIHRAILEMKAMPSMRLLAMAGPAAKRNGISIYNCSYLPVDRLSSFVEALIISMSGCGVGYSVEKQYVEKLPVPIKRGPETRKYVIEDSSEGWADALDFALDCFTNGISVDFDYSNIRPAGAPLLTKGGRASGPAPLRKMIDFIDARMKEVAQRGHWRPLDAHDIMCSVGDAAVQGGVRRTAMIALFSKDDHEMRHCKDGDFWRDNPQRWNANNSAVWVGNETEREILNQMYAMIDGERGEPGIFNRSAAKATMPMRRARNYDFGTNPCGEIVLRPYQFCNLTSAVLRPEMSFEEVKQAVRIATIIGTIQSMETNFPGLNSEWKRNAEEERLLGVDLNGLMDYFQSNQSLADMEKMLNELRVVATDTNIEYAAKLGINLSASITCVKPSGNSSTLLDTSPGIHPRWSQYYIRNVRVGATSPIYKVMRDAGVPMSPENGQTLENATTWVAHFPVKAPQGALTRHDIGAETHLDFWSVVKTAWTEHNPSATINYGDDEVISIIDWVNSNAWIIGGLTFLPRTDAMYENMPYVEISEEEYEAALKKFPTIQFSKVYLYEETDLTKAAQELACVAGYCEII